MTTFASWIDQFPKWDEAALARKAIKEVPELLVDQVADRIRDHRRRQARAAEHGAVSDLLNAFASLEAPAVGESGRIVLPLETLFAQSDGTKVSWGEATIDQHQDYVGILLKQESGLCRTRHLHDQAIQLLEKTGAKCLNELHLTEAVA